MKRASLPLMVMLIAYGMVHPGVSMAEEFSLFGVTMGMPRSEVDTLWTPAAEGEYQIEGSTLFNVLPEFDHRDRLYRLSFSTPIPLLDQFPAQFAATAFQQAVQERWGTKGYTVNIRTGRGIADVTVTSKDLQQGYNEHVKAQMEFQMQSILRSAPLGSAPQP